MEDIDTPRDKVRASALWGLALLPGPRADWPTSCLVHELTGPRADWATTTKLEGHRWSLHD